MLGGGPQGKSSHSKQKQSTLLGFFKKIEKVKVPSSSDVISNESQENVISNTQNHTILSQNSSHDHQPVQIPSKNAVMPEEEEEDLFIKPNPKRLKASRIVDSDDESDQASPMPATPSLSRLKSNFQMKSANRGSATPDSSFSTGTHATPLSKMSALPKATPTLTATPSLAHFKSNLSSNATPASLQSRAEKFKEKNEERYSWLLNIKDQNEHPIGHPDYDPRTLHIPKSAWNNFTPFEKQFWEIKSKHWDTVVFFKKGKFFELYENDATIGHQHFDLKLTDRVNMRMVGVPESSFHHWASQFIARGFKVAKVEQMENAIGKQIRGKKSAQKEDKIIRRELTSVLTNGTLVDGEFLTSDKSSFLMAIKEEQKNPQLPPSFGIAFVDTSTAEFNVSSFVDDMNRTKLETIIAQLRPQEFVLEKNQFSKASMKILKNCGSSLAQFNYLTPGLEFWSPELALEELKNGNYFESSEDGDKMQEDGSSNESWPDAIKKAAGEPLSLSAFGALVWYLRSLKLDKSLLSASNVHLYDPIKSTSSLILDGQTLMNLEIFNNNVDGSDKGSLFKLINHCNTPFGKRMFHRWVCHPLCSIPDINSRLDAIDDFLNLQGVLDDMQKQLVKLPDLERIIARIHSGNCLVRDFVNCLKCFDQVRDLLSNLATYSDQLKSAKLKKILQYGWPDELVESLNYLTTAFNHQEAATKGSIELHEGFDTEFDQLRENVQLIENKLEAYRKETSKSLGVTIQYRDIGKEVYQFEISKNDCKKVPRDWVEVSKTQAVGRWYNEKLRGLISQLLEAKEILEGGMREAKSRLYQHFDEQYHLWMQIILNISEIDCLMGLALCRKSMSGPVCRPEFIEGESLLELEEMCHPCVMQSISSEYIPNDLTLRNSRESMVLLTGPNMGGKSTLLRQTCIAVIMAQLGCYVPAKRCKLTPFDRIFTRIGANDNIMAGQSTFMVELTETAKILKEATDKSLVILDELGRGTSTFDGYAIAYAVLYHLVSKVGCLGLFSTHYGTLTNEFESHPLVSLKYMDFLVDQDSQQVTFLYKLADGKCPQSYGMNVARMARIPETIIENAEKMAQDFDENHSFKTAGEGVLIDLLTLANFHSLATNEENSKRVFQSL